MKKRHQQLACGAATAATTPPSASSVSSSTSKSTPETRLFCGDRLPLLFFLPFVAFCFPIAIMGICTLMGARAFLFMDSMNWLCDAVVLRIKSRQVSCKVRNSASADRMRSAMVLRASLPGVRSLSNCLARRRRVPRRRSRSERPPSSEMPLSEEHPALGGRIPYCKIAGGSRGFSERMS